MNTQDTGHIQHMMMSNNKLGRHADPFHSTSGDFHVSGRTAIR